MRVIAGTLRGRRLRPPRDAAIRPTSDRLRETLFDILAPRLPGAVFLDLFAGTGAVGIEALSRRAREVVFVESSRDALRLIRANLEACAIRHGFRIEHVDVFTALRSLGRRELRADLIFLDPPYDWGPYRDLVDLLFRARIAGPTSRVVVEHHRKSALHESGRGYRRVREVVQGDHALSFYEAEPPEG
jgi:16S rRNA (guanine(966)-N(2))-methyltransferase RsmD